MCNCKNCQCEIESNHGGFTFGLLLGAVIGAVIAVIIYKNNRTEVFSGLKEKLEKYFKQFTTESKPKSKHENSTLDKIPVILPNKIVVNSASTKTKLSKPRKMFKK